MGGQQHCLSMCRWAWGGTCAAGGSATGPAASPARGTLRPQLATPEARGKKEFEKCASQLGICNERAPTIHRGCSVWGGTPAPERSEEHTSELQSRLHLVCRLLLEKKKQKTQHTRSTG